MKKFLFLFLSLSSSLIGVSQTYNVTFQVDMTGQTGFTTPEVNGTFNTWCGNCFVMTDTNGDNIWEATTALPAGTYEYKFSADNWGSQETLIAGSSCTVTNSGYTNRALNVTADTVLPVVCWGSCVDCASTPNTYHVTFRVDMNGVSGFTTPEVNGTFNSWCGNCTQMQDPDGDNIWEITVALLEGAYDYKYSFDNWGGQEALAVGSPCTTTAGGYTNRYINVTSDATLDVVCFGSCSACGQSTGPWNIVFEVDMNQVSFAYTAPEVNGTFNNWCGNCAAMSDPEGDHIWTITIPLNTGEYDYKFSYDNWAGQEEIAAGGACIIDINGFINRHISVTQATTIGAVCWGSCNLCTTGIEELSNENLDVFPNPVANELIINTSQFDAGQISIYDMVGKKIETQNFVGQKQTRLNTETLPSGTYMIQVKSGNQTHQTKFIKKQSILS